MKLKKALLHLFVEFPTAPKTACSPMLGRQKVLAPRPLGTCGSKSPREKNGVQIEDLTIGRDIYIYVVLELAVQQRI